MIGKHICFCGLDGAGKTTQAKYLKQYYEGIKQECEIIHGFKPGKNNEALKIYAKKNGDKFREAYPATIRSISYLCDIHENYFDKIFPKLQSGCNVISDKYVMDSIVNAPLLGANAKIIEDFATVIPNPDIYICLLVEPEEAYHRTKLRGGQDSESKKNSLDFMRHTYQIYKGLEDKYSNVVCVDGIDDEKKVSIKIIKILSSRSLI